MSTLYKEHILELYRNPENKHPLATPTHQHREHNPLCGDDLTLYLHVEDGVIHDASFTGTGCAISIACASLLTEHLKGKTITDALALDEDDIIALIDIPIGPVRIKCATLSLHATQHALEGQ